MVELLNYQTDAGRLGDIGPYVAAHLFSANSFHAYLEFVTIFLTTSMTIFSLAGPSVSTKTFTLQALCHNTAALDMVT